MTPDQYQERVRAALDSMRTAAKDAILTGFIAALYPQGDPDHPVNGADFIAEAIRLLTPFHPDQLQFPAPTSAAEAETEVPEF